MLKLASDTRTTMVQHVQDGGSVAGAGLHQQVVQEMSLLEAHSVMRVLQRDMGRSELGPASASSEAARILTRSLPCIRSRFYCPVSALVYLKNRLSRWT